MIIFAFFTNNGVPATGLSPIIDIRTEDGTLVVSGDSMVEVGGGAYQYDHLTFIGSDNYAYVADGGSSLPNSERYVFGSNEISGVWEAPLADHLSPGSAGAIVSNIEGLVTIIDQIQEGTWKIVGNQLVFFNTASAELFRFDLFDSDDNPTNTNVFERRRVI